MKFLLKLFCLLSLLSSFLFADLKIYSDENLKGYDFKSIDMKFLKGNNLLGFRDRGGYAIYPFTFDHSYYSGSKYSPGFYWGAGNFVYFGADKTSNHLYVEMDTWSYTVYGISNDPNRPFLTYSSLLFFRLGDLVATCGVNQEFNTETNKCVDPCPAGHFWNVETNSCIFDCSDEDHYKFFTNDYKCIDCSSALTKVEIAKCYCTGLGSSFNNASVVFGSNSENPNFVTTFCDNETEISFKNVEDKIKDKDNNSTNSSDKDKDNPKPDKDKDNPKPDKDKDNPNPDKKDNNENSNNSSGESGNPSNNNSGGTSGNGSSGGGGTGVETKPNPNHNGNGKEDGKSDGKGEEGKGDDNIGPANLDYEGLKASSETFEGQFKTAIDDSFSFVNDVKASLTDTLQKIKDGNLMSLKKGAVPTTCPLSFQIYMTYFSKNLTFDFCKIVSPVSSSLYILFYLAFFILFLVVTIKLFILTFMGW